LGRRSAKKAGRFEYGRTSGGYVPMIGWKLRRRFSLSLNSAAFGAHHPITQLAILSGSSCPVSQPVGSKGLTNNART